MFAYGGRTPWGVEAISVFFPKPSELIQVKRSREELGIREPNRHHLSVSIRALANLLEAVDAETFEAGEETARAPYNDFGRMRDRADFARRVQPTIASHVPEDSGAGCDSSVVSNAPVIDVLAIQSKAHATRNQASSR
jgi:phage I-like protein